MSGQTAGIAEALDGVVDGPQRKVFAAGRDAVACAFGTDEMTGKRGQRAECGAGGAAREAQRKGRCPAAEMLAEELPLRVAEKGQLIVVLLMLEGKGLLRGEHAEELQLDAHVVESLAGVASQLEAEGGVERAEVGEAMRLEERVGVEVAILDLVERTVAAHGVAEARDARGGVVIEGFAEQRGVPVGGESGEGVVTERGGGLTEAGKRFVAAEQSQGFWLGVFKGLGQDAMEKGAGDGEVNGLLKR